MIVIDVGAHDGSIFSLPYAQHKTVQIYAIEPNPYLAEGLATKNIRNLNVRCFAMGELDGEADFYVNKDDQTSSLLRTSCDNPAWVPFQDKLSTVNVIQVPVRRLDTFLKAERIFEVDILKIDSQGSDFQVIKGAGDALGSIRKILLEVQLEPLYEGSASKEEIVDYLSDKGFQLIKAVPQTDGLEENLEFVRHRRFPVERDAKNNCSRVYVPHTGHLKVPHKDHVGKLIADNMFEAWEQAFVWLYLQAGDTFLDCGAHVGLFSMIAARRLGNNGRILGIDPNPLCRDFYESNLIASGFPNFDIFQLALSDQDSESKLFLGKEGMSAFSSLSPGIIEHPEISADALLVKSTRLDKLLDELNVEQVSLAKLDVEGLEISVLEGAKNSILSGKLPVWMIEFTESNAISSNTSTKQLWDKLEALGYTICRFDITQLQIVPEQRKETYPYENLIATTDLELVNQRLKSASSHVLSIAKDLITRHDMAIDRQSFLQQLVDLESKFYDTQQTLTNTQQTLTAQIQELEQQLTLRQAEYDSLQETNHSLKIENQELAKTTKGLEEKYLAAERTLNRVVPARVLFKQWLRAVFKR